MTLLPLFYRTLMISLFWLCWLLGDDMVAKLLLAATSDFANYGPSFTGEAFVKSSVLFIY